jgi:hypothetical protein
MVSDVEPALNTEDPEELYAALDEIIVTGKQI